MTRGRGTGPIDERMAQRYAASLVGRGKSSQADLGFTLMPYRNESTQIIHLCRTAQVGVCGKWSGQRQAGNRLRLTPANEWTSLEHVEPDQFPHICTTCARHIWRQRQAILDAKRKVSAR